MLTGILGGAAAIVAVYAYILRLKLQAARRESRAWEMRAENCEKVIDDVKNLSGNIDDPDQRKRLREKLRVRPA